MHDAIPHRAPSPQPLTCVPVEHVAATNSSPGLLEGGSIP